MATYTVTIDLDDQDTLNFLIGKSLRVYKGVKTDAKGVPVVWFSQNLFAKSLTFSWTENYGGFVRDGGVPAVGVNISDVTTDAMELGDKMVVTDAGTSSVDRKGVGGAITISNSGSRDWGCGMGQIVQGKLSPVCIFDLGGMGESVIMMPYEKIVLVFESSRQIDTGSVIAEAISASCTIELDGSNLNRAVEFRKATGWTTNKQGWVTVNDDSLDLADALIVPT